MRGTMVINSIIFINDENRKIITLTEIYNTFNSLKSIVGENNLPLFLPNDRDFITDEEYFELRALFYIFLDISKCTGFDTHLQEYKNNYNTSYFVSHFASYLIAHGFDVELEPIIEGILKKPDMKAERSGIIFYFECKRPTENHCHVYQKEIFDVLQKYITNDYSLAVFFASPLDQNKLNDVGEIIHKKTSDLSKIYEGQVLYEDENLNFKVEISGCQKISDQNDLIISGIPVFNHLGYETACGINHHGKNIIFYKYANKNIIKNQFKKSRSKTSKESNYIVAICTDDRRIDSENISENINSLFKDPLYSEIAGVIIANTIFDVSYNYGLEIEYFSNTYAKNDLSFLRDFFAKRVIKIQK